MDICQINATCSNIDGSYTCTCSEGYTGNGTLCQGQYPPWIIYTILPSSFQGFFTYGVIDYLVPFLHTILSSASYQSCLTRNHNCFFQNCSLILSCCIFVNIKGYAEILSCLFLLWRSYFCYFRRCSFFVNMFSINKVRTSFASYNLMQFSILEIFV